MRLSSFILTFDRRMIRLIRYAGFRMSTSEQVLLQDGLPIDSMPYDIPKEVLHREVSDILKIPYLSRCTQTKQEIARISIYKGAIMGNSSRVFFSIPTARQDSQEFYYVHYLLDICSPDTTLTHQALCCLYGENPNNPDVRFPSISNIQIGGRVSLWARRSKPDPDESDRNQNYYHNANLLGKDFLDKFKGYKLYVQKFDRRSATLELIK